MSRIAPWLISSDQLTVAEEIDLSTPIPNYTVATLPTDPTLGLLAVTTDRPGFWLADGSQWISYPPVGYVDVAGYATGGTGTAGDPWVGWDTAIDWTTYDHRIARPGVYKFTAQIDIQAGSLLGCGCGINAIAANYGPTVFLKNGSFHGILVSGSGVTLSNLQVDGDTGNTLGGIVVTGTRNHLQNVAVTSHGGVGLRIGDIAVVAGNANLNRLTNVFCLSNGSHGLYVHDADVVPNANNLIVVGLDCRSNGGDGIAVENAIDGQYFGVHTASNTGHGIRCYSGALGHGFWMPYIEANTAGEFQSDAGSGRNMVWGTRTQTGDAYVDNGTGNLILGRATEVDLFFLRTALSFLKLNINHPSISGQWELRQNASDRTLEIAGVNTSSTPLDVKFVHDTAGAVRLWIPVDSLFDGNAITIGANDTGGTGYRALVVPNA